MGACTSKSDTKLAWRSWTCVFEALHLSYRDFSIYYLIFTKLDHSNCGTIAIDDLLHFLRINSNQYAVRILTIFEENVTRRLDFGEFVMGHWNLCTHSPKSLIPFSFSLYDTDHDGSLSLEEIRNLFLDAFCAMHSYKVADYIKKLDLMMASIQGQTMNVTEFQNLTLTHPLVLVPILDLQVNIRRRILGRSRWQRLRELPVSLPNGSKMSVLEFKSKKLFKNLLTHNERVLLESFTVDSVRDIMSQGDRSESPGPVVVTRRASEKRVKVMSSSKDSSFNSTTISRRIFPIKSDKTYPIGDEQHESMEYSDSDDDDYSRRQAFDLAKKPSITKKSSRRKQNSWVDGEGSPLAESCQPPVAAVSLYETMALEVECLE